MNEIIKEISGTPFPMIRVIRDVINERAAQILKWGRQSHEAGNGNLIYEALESMAKAQYKVESEEGVLTWATILEEEFYEALATKNKEDLRKELLQVAAVSIAWCEDLDSRSEK